MKKTLCLLISLFVSFLTFSQINIQQARQQSLGSSVTVKGIVTNGSELGVIRFLQDTTAGIAVYDAALSALNRGDSVSITGILTDYNGLLEINSVSNWSVLSSGLPVPDAKTVSLPAGFNNNYEAQLLKLNAVHFTNNGTFSTSSTNYTISDGTNTAAVRIIGSTNIGGTAIPSGNINLIGLLGEYNGTFQLQPRDLSDFETSGPKVVTALTQSNISTTGFTVSFETQDSGTTHFRYGLTPAFGSSLSNPTMSTTHSMALGSMSPATIFYVQGFSIDVNGDTSFTETAPMMTASLSSGNIKVYFNKPVDQSVNNGTPATFLYHTFDDTLIAYINRAKQSIDLAIYNLDNAHFIVTALNDAFNRGVNIRVIANNGVNASAYNALNIGSGKKKKSPSGTAPSGGNYGEMHNKLMIIDANATNPNIPIVITGSTNFTDAQLMTDANNMIIFQDQSLARACELEFAELWSGKFGPEKIDNTPHQFLIGDKQVELYFAPSDGPEDKIIKTINSADYDLYLAMFAWTRYGLAYDIKDRINQDAVFGGAILNDTSTTGLPYQIVAPYMPGTLFLYSKSGILHHKYLIVDANDTSSDPLVLTGSYNWSNNAKSRNDENFVIVHDASIANQYYQEWAQRFRDEGGNIFVGNKPLISSSGYLSLFPNPASTTIHIKYSGSPEGNGLIRIMDAFGRTLMQKPMERYQDLDVNNIPAGFYILQYDNQGHLESIPFIKQ